MPPLSQWMSDAIDPETPQSRFENLAVDGFGVVVKILRDMKSSWKLLLGEMEDFLEDLIECFDEEEFIEAAPYRHREFLPYIDYSRRQLFYHQRYLSYLVSHAEDIRCIYPSRFRPDMLQEGDALKVLDSRLMAIRDRTTTVLDMIISLTSIKQARLSSELLLLQRQDAASSLQQGESLKRLTMLNIMYLPPSFVAVSDLVDSFCVYRSTLNRLCMG
ncbi:MAG: hypothetical protein Q9163_003777 [Psora crenata]